MNNSEFIKTYPLEIVVFEEELEQFGLISGEQELPMSEVDKELNEALSEIDENFMQEFEWSEKSWLKINEATNYLRSIGIDVDGLIKLGLAVDKTQIKDLPINVLLTINGRHKSFGSLKITYDEVINLAFDFFVMSNNYTVTYSNKRDISGTLVKGQELTISSGMIFNVSATGKA